MQQRKLSLDMKNDARIAHEFRNFLYETFLSLYVTISHVNVTKKTPMFNDAAKITLLYNGNKFYAGKQNRQKF